MARSFLNPEFYATFPSYGKNLSFQWDELRKDLNVLNALAKAEVLEVDSDTDLPRARLSGLELGQYDFHNEFRFFFDKTDDLLKIQRNTGTEDEPIWVTVLSFNGTGGAIGKVQEIGGVGTPDVFYFPHTLYIQRPDLTLEDNGSGQPVLTYNSQLRVDERGAEADEDVLHVTRIRVQTGTGLNVIEEGTGIARLEFDDIGSVIPFYFQTPAREWVVNHNFGSSVMMWNLYDKEQRAIHSYDPLRSTRNNLLEADFSLPNTAYFYFQNPQAGFAILAAGGIAQINANITVRDGFHEVTDDEINFNGTDFYITRRAGGQPVINLQPTPNHDHPEFVARDGSRSFTGVLTGNLHVDQVVVAEAFYLQPGSGGEISKSGQDMLVKPAEGGKLILGGHVTVTDSVQVANIVTAEAFYLTTGGELGSGGSGETNTASNLGAGEGIFAQKIGVDLQLKSLTAGTGISLSSTSTEVQISATGGAGGGGFYGVIFDDGSTQLRDDVLQLNPNDFYLSQDADGKPQLNLVGGGAGEANTASNLGAGNGVFAQKVGVDLQFKSLVAGTGVTLTPAADTITIDATGGGGGGGFYGIIFNDGDTSLRDDTLTLHPGHFYLSQDADGKPQLNLTQPKQKFAISFLNSVEVVVTHNFADEDHLWSVRDTNRRAFIPYDIIMGANVDTFYFVQSTSGRIVLLA